MSKMQRIDKSATPIPSTTGRPKRLSGLQCLQLLEQLAEDDSGEEPNRISISDCSDSESSTSEPCPDVENSSDSSSVTSDAEVTDQQQSLSAASSMQERGCGRLPRRGSRGRGRVQRATNSDILTSDCAFVARDGTVWLQAEAGVESAGRRAQHNLLRDKAGPTAYASRIVKEASVMSAFKLLIDEPMLRHVKKCTETEARQKRSDESWTVTLEELEAVTAIIYARGASGAKGLPVKSLWDKKWGLGFFKQTMARNRFCEILKYLRFDVKSTRTSRLQHDKFALASEVW